MKGSYGLKHGGLMRCCLLTLDDAMVARSDDHPLEEGEKLPCRWCKESVIYTGGYWQWDHPPLDPERKEL